MESDSVFDGIFNWRDAKVSRHLIPLLIMTFALFTFSLLNNLSPSTRGILTYVLFSISIFAYGHYGRMYLIISAEDHTDSSKVRELNGLIRFEFSHYDVKTLQNEATCSICICDFEEADRAIRIVICGHCFHTECLKKWLEKHCICPYCRSDINNRRMAIK